MDIKDGKRTIPHALLTSGLNAKKQLQDLRLQLKQLEQKRSLLKRKLYLEKLATLMLSSTMDIVSDKGKLKDINQVKTKMTPCLNTIIENTYLQGLNSAYRLTGVTTFPFKNSRCLRVDTFYNQRYYESYFIVLTTLDSSVRIHHNIPDFIDIANMNDTILSYDVLAFNRMITELLVAYVSRREQYYEFKMHVDRNLAEIKADKKSYTEMHITVSDPSQPRYTLTISYDNWASIYPTKVDIKRNDTGLSSWDDVLYWNKASYWNNIVTAYKSNTLLKAHTISKS